MKNYIQIYSLLVPCFFLLNLTLEGQTYFGAGNDENISVIASGATGNSIPRNTLNGGGLDAKLMEASRFLSQTTFGATYEDIESLQDLDFESWIDNQLALPVNELTPLMWEIWNQIEEAHINSFDRYLANYIQELCYEYYHDETGNVSEPQPLTEQEVDELREYFNTDIFGPSGLTFNFAWSHNTMTSPDQLRQRTAYALSQILVASNQSDLGDYAQIVTSYYDILQRNAFGNFEDLLMEVTLSPAMGFYLSHLNNSKAIPDENIHPDENYAREIMQLFSIGLYELNLNGTRKKDSAGNDIPTYNNADIKQLAKVFTGLSAGSLDPRMNIEWTDEAYFGIGLYAMNKTEPLVMYQDYHDVGSKYALNDLEVPAGMEGIEEIKMVVNYLFNHNNVAPFISRQLIQRMIKSNPSPEYIERVAIVFNDNGQGVRGDMGAVIKAILMDEEARSCEAFLNPTNGRLNEPLLRSRRLMKATPHMGYKQVFELQFNDYSCSGIDTIRFEDEIVFDNLRYWDNGYNFYDEIKQYPMLSPTVFNFYLPNHKPVGEISNQELVGPEFKIHNSSTAINYFNHIWMMANPWFNVLWYNWLESYGFETLQPRYDEWTKLFQEDPEKLINHLDIVLTNGKLSDQTRNTLRQFLRDVPSWPEDSQVMRSMLYLILVSPDYSIDK